MKQKALTLSLIILMSAACVFAPLASVLGQSPTGFTILQVTQQGGYTAISSANVGAPITVLATLNLQSAPYTMWFGNVLVDNGTSTGYYIAANFTVPEVPAGSYNITLQDDTLAQNTTYTFDVNTQYLIEPNVPQAPVTLQEGNSVSLNVSITGGNASETYTANVTLSLPSPLSTNFTKLITFTANSGGTAATVVTFPDSSFEPAGSTTIYTGTYEAYFNQSEGLASSNFFIGFTDKSSYHRGDTVDIRAVGYQASQTGTLSIKQDSATVLSQQVTADANGVITSSWTIPDTTQLGIFNVTITPSGTPKAIPDSQNITLPGYAATFSALDLANQLVYNISIDALDQATNQISNGVTDAYGYTTIYLERGNYTVTAYWNDVSVGDMQLSVSGNTSASIQCQLVNMQITVQDKNGIVIPFVNLNLTYTYVTTKTHTSETGTAQVQTDVSGNYTFHSILPGITYTVDAYKYDVVFNSGNATVSNLPSQANNKVVVICPDESLTLKTTDFNSASLPNARLVLIEQTSGIFYSATTDNSGSASLQVTFGQYKVSVYTADNVLLNQTVVDVLSSTQSQIQCALYNLHFSVKVVDYFGNPISNINVEFSRTGTSTRTATTQGDGTATFDNVIGGDVEVVAYPSGNEGSFVATNLQLSSPQTVQMQMAKYVSLGGLLVDVSLLVSILLVVVAVVVLVAFEVLRRRGFSLRGKTKS